MSHVTDTDLIAQLTRERNALREALQRMIAEFEKMTRYGSPLARAANENLTFARKALEAARANKEEVK